jgi:hypothetical protein
MLGVDMSPRSNRVGSGSAEENYRRNGLDAAGIAAALRDAVGEKGATSAEN